MIIFVYSSFLSFFLVDVDYDIIISTGDQTIEVPVTLKIRGENGTTNIPLTKTKTGEKPFQSKSTQEFTEKTTDVGKIKRITIEHQGTEENLVWHIKTIQIKKGNETYKLVRNSNLIFQLIDLTFCFLVLMQMYVLILKKIKLIFILLVLYLDIKEKIMFKVNYVVYEKVFELNQRNYVHLNS